MARPLFGVPTGMPPLLINQEATMPKGQRSSKEAKKPKKDTSTAKPLQTGVSARPSAPSMPELVKKKKPLP